MKKQLLWILSMITIGYLCGTTYTVNNLPNTDPDFTNLSVAHSMAQPGDTLYVCGSNVSYGNVTISKRLTLIGTGFFLNQNPYTQMFQHSSYVPTITFNSGSSGSTLTGLTLHTVAINTNNITLRRNCINTSDHNWTSRIVIASGVSQVVITQNFLAYLSNDWGPYMISLAGNNNSIYIANNIFRIYEDTSISVPNTSYATIENNVFHGGIVNINNTLFQNNIMRSGSFNSGTGSTVRNNICNSDQFGNSNGNIPNMDMNAVFVTTGTTDGLYQLSPGSPAYGTGINGTDCGCFGGVNPYVLSGMPAGIPSIYEVIAPSSGFVFPIQIKIKAH
ncbi:hypothetical protein MASR1M36_14090 [Candidatus Cloacimonadaceae bacterium]